MPGRVEPIEAVGTSDDAAGLDGRRARRDRNRDAVVEAFLDLLREGNLSPGVGEVAERSGVSHRSVFRYFEDLEELFRVAIEHQHARTDHLAQLDRVGEGSLEDRVDRLVHARLALFEALAHVMIAARARAPFQKILYADLTRGRTLLRAQVNAHFRPELSTMTRSDADAVLSAVDVLCGFETYDLLRNDQTQSRDRVTATLTNSLLRLLRR